ncbi:MAG TPA: metalloregulator ArsR/SmtB family transcription factor [Rhizomicrobium sp.]|nr:metalloregulator ArsR/SmtB family transcription factor [Rhizomicrobium sp.]
MNVATARNPDLLRTKAAEAARLLEMMANPRRLMILCELADGERSVGELVPVVGLQQAALSQHLARLRTAGLVSTRRASQMIYYRLANPAVIAVINTLAAVFCPDRASKRRNTA